MAVPMLVKVLLALEPSVVMAAMHTTMMRANITAYSTAVGPSSRCRKWIRLREMRDSIAVVLSGHQEKDGYGIQRPARCLAASSPIRGHSGSITFGETEARGTGRRSGDGGNRPLTHCTDKDNMGRNKSAVKRGDAESAGFAGSGTGHGAAGSSSRRCRPVRVTNTSS